MKKLVLILLFGLLGFTPFNQDKKVENLSKVEKELIGKWTGETRTDPDFAGKKEVKSKGIFEFQENRTFKVTEIVYQEQTNTQIVEKGTWKITAGKLELKFSGTELMTNTTGLNRETKGMPRNVIHNVKFDKDKLLLYSEDGGIKKALVFNKN